MLNDWPGYEIVEKLITEDECDRLLDAISHNQVGTGRAGVRHLMSNSSVRNIADDDRMRSIAERIAGRTMIPYKATLFEKTGKANWLVTWHQDRALPLTEIPEHEEWGPSTVKEGVIYSHAPTRALSQILALRLHLDPSTELNGPLRVLPHSHHDRLVVSPDHQESENDSVKCLVEKGGVIAMSPLTLHASSKCSSNDPRRVLHIEYAPTLEIDRGVSLAIA
jgi:ectoine hydroxylase-related dioxygenase (phytanoyl-CoA dioxygenase family)